MRKPYPWCSLGIRNIVSGIFILILISGLIFSALLSPRFLDVSAQSDNKSVQTRIDDRLTQAQDNTMKLRQVPGEKVPDQYIVVLKGRTAPSASVRASADEARNQGALVRHVYEHAIQGFAIKIPNDRVLTAILNNPRVDYVQPDLKLKAFTQTLPTGIDRTDADLSSARAGDGTGSVDADIAILDTGIELTHPDLNVFKQITFVSGTSSGNDDNGHGTHVAGIAAAKDNAEGVVGMAPGARLWAVKVLDRSGNGFDSDIIAGIDYITQHANEIDSVNMSFGGDCCDNALHTAVSNSVAAGVVYTAAAGNEKRDAGSVEPANYPEVIAVSAIADTDGKCGAQGGSGDDILAPFSNFGSVVDMAAPGVSIRSTYRGSTYATLSGTSMATPHVTGAAALYKSLHQGATPSEVRNALLSSGSIPSTICDGKGHGYFKGDKDSFAEPLLYLASSSIDATPPTVVSTNPAGGATGIAVSSSVVATFSEAVQSATVTGSTFTLKNSAGTIFSGAVSLSTDAKTATLKPSSSLAASTSYTATITTGVKDLAGNAMTTAKSWSFTTAAAADTTAPTVVSTNPSNGATGVSITTSITGTFSEAVQSSTVSTSTFTLKNSAGTFISGTVSLSSDAKTATFKSSSSLAASTSYTATITTGVKDLAGNAMTTAKSWSFTTAADASDTVPPTVVNTNPGGGATGIAVSSSIVATFSEAVQSSTVTTSTYTLKNSDGTSIPGTVTLSTDSKVATFKPSSPLAYSTSYTAAATSGIKDLAGNLLTQKSWSFTTVAAPTSSCGNTLPLVTATSSGSQSSFLPANAIDNNFNTRWYSTFIVNPWIQVNLGAQKSVCSVDIAWPDGASRQYSFQISLSTDGSSYTNVFSGKSSGTTSSSQKYAFPENEGRYVKITITQSHAGSTRSIAQISEIDVFGKASSSASSKQLPISSQSLSKQEKLDSNTASSIPVGPSLSLNKPPVAKDDRIKTEINKPMEIGILRNDNDPDRDKLKIVSVTSPTQKGGIVVINLNGTVTFFPGLDYTGTDRFSYTISDGEGNSDKAKVSVTVNAPPPSPSPSPPKDSTADKQSSPRIQENQNGDGVNLEQKNQADNRLASEMIDRHPFQNGGGGNDTGNNIR